MMSSIGHEAESATSTVQGLGVAFDGSHALAARSPAAIPAEDERSNGWPGAVSLEAHRRIVYGIAVSAVAHDLNNLLTVVLGHAEMAAAQLDATSGPGLSISEIIESSETAATLTGDLLCAGRRAGGQPAVVDVGGLLRQTAALARPIIPRTARIDVRAPEGLWPVEVIKADLQQAVIALLTNASDAMAGRGTIALLAENTLVSDSCTGVAGARPGRHVCITVADTGTGMTEEMQRRAFEPFFSTKSPRGHCGLGLTAVRIVARRSHGWATLASERGGGTVAKVYLPAYR